MIPAGALILARGGSSRDWNPLGIFRAVANIDVTAERQQWVKTLPDDIYAHSEEFLAWLVDVRGALVEVPTVQLTVEPFCGDDELPRDEVAPFAGLTELMTGPRSQDPGVRRKALSAEIATLYFETSKKMDELASLIEVAKEKL